MNEELTNEVLEALGSCMNTCGDDCKARGVCLPGQSYVRRKLATALLEERAKPKVWDGAPNEAASAVVNWCRSGEKVGSVSYNRKLPKTRVRWLLENPDCPFKSCQFWDNNADGKCGGELHGGSAQESCLWYADYESALTKYAEELKGEA
jgi:hypothetical protein